MQKLLIDVQVLGIAAALVADLQELAGALGGLHHGAGGLDGVGHHLLAVHRAPGLQAHDGVGRVHEVGRRDEHRLDVGFLVQQFLDILVLDHVMALPLELLGDVFAVEGPDVADRLDLDSGDEDHRVAQYAALFAAAHDGDLQLASRLGGVLGEGGLGGGQGGGSHGSVLMKSRRFMCGGVLVNGWG